MAIGLVGGIVGALLLLVGSAAATVWITSAVQRATCRDTSGAMGLAWRYRFTTGCLVSVNGRTMQLKAYRQQP